MLQPRANLFLCESTMGMMMDMAMPMFMLNNAKISSHLPNQAIQIL